MWLIATVVESAGIFWEVFSLVPMPTMKRTRLVISDSLLYLLYYAVNRFCLPEMSRSIEKELGDDY